MKLKADESLYLRLRHGTGGVMDDFAVFEQKERRNGLHAEGRGKILAIVDIARVDLDLILVLLRNLLENRRERMARSAPDSREIDNDLTGALEDLLFEVRLLHRKVRHLKLYHSRSGK